MGQGSGPQVTSASQDTVDFPKRLTQIIKLQFTDFFSFNLFILT